MSSCDRQHMISILLLFPCGPGNVGWLGLGTQFTSYWKKRGEGGSRYLEYVNWDLGGVKSL